MSEVLDLSGTELEAIEPPPTAPLTIISAEIDVQIATAKRYPRSVDSFMRRLNADVTVSADVAEQCFYTLERFDKKKGETVEIFGPSIRFAEILLARWGNCRAASRIVDTSGHFAVAHGAFHDLETNAAVSKESQRRITDSKGRRYSVDMIGVTGNAAASIALRNAILAGIPQAYWRMAYLAALKTAMGTTETFATKRKRAMDWFAERGVLASRVYAALGVKGAADIGGDQILMMAGWKTAIDVEGVKPDEIFPPAETVARPAPAVPPAQPNPDGSTPEPVPPTQGKGAGPSGTPPPPAAPPAPPSGAASPKPQGEPAPASAPVEAFTFPDQEAARQFAADYREDLNRTDSATAVRDLKAKHQAQLNALHDLDEDLSLQLAALATDLIEAFDEDAAR